MPSRPPEHPGPRRREGRGSASASWRQSPERAELLALYAEADGLLAGWTCACTADPAPGCAADTPCCHFGVTGLEPYPTAIELEEVRHAMRAAGITLAPAAPSRRLPLAPPDDRRPCPLLSASGRCRIYASRPLGCRTFFCQGAEAPYGARTKPPRDAANALGRRIADLSARFAPRDPQPCALTKGLGPVSSRSP
jgi:Fe-S-cluster containining protein